METVVYADVLVALNIYVTYFLLVLTRLILKYETKKIPFTLSSVIGGFSSLTVLVEPIGAPFDIALKVIFCAVITSVAFLPKNIKSFFKSFTVYFTVSVIFAGVMLAIEFTVHPKNMVFINGTVYFDVSVLFIVLASVGCYGLVLLVDRFLRHRAAEKTLYKVRIYFRNESAELVALYDTGNNLTDGIEGRPVIIAELNSVQKLFYNDEREFFKGKITYSSPPESLKKYMRIVPCRGVGDISLLPAFIPERILIFDGEKTCEAGNCVIAVTNVKLNDGEYSAILNNSIFERGKMINETF